MTKYFNSQKCFWELICEISPHLFLLVARHSTEDSFSFWNKNLSSSSIQHSRQWADFLLTAATLHTNWECYLSSVWFRFGPEFWEQYRIVSRNFWGCFGTKIRAGTGVLNLHNWAEFHSTVCVFRRQKNTESVCDFAGCSGADQRQFSGWFWVVNHHKIVSLRAGQFQQKRGWAEILLTDASSLAH